MNFIEKLYCIYLSTFRQLQTKILVKSINFDYTSSKLNISNHKFTLLIFDNMKFKLIHLHNNIFVVFFFHCINHLFVTYNLLNNNFFIKIPHICCYGHFKNIFRLQTRNNTNIASRKKNKCGPEI